MASTTPHPEADRLKAFELYLAAGESGRRVSYRSISQKMGIHEATIRRWARVDGWNEKLQKNLGVAAETAEASGNLIKRRLRVGLLSGIQELETIILNADKDSDRIAAVKALAEIAERMDAVSHNIDASQKDHAGTVEFKDDIKEAEELEPLSEVKD
jgi:transposase-like protein